MDFILKCIRNLNDLSKYLSISSDVIEKIVADEDRTTYLKIARIPKYPGAFRKVVIVHDMSYRLILKILTSYLNNSYIPPACVFGYIKNGSIVKNAKEHLNKKYVLKLDIENYFYSITTDHVFSIFQNLEANHDVSSILSKLTTYQGVLFPGLNTSPVLSNIYCKNLDTQLVELSEKYNSTYTRYADDIVISSNRYLPDKETIQSILLTYGFKINEKKYKTMKAGKYQVVTGLTVFDKRIPRIPRNKKQQIRMACFLLNKNGKTEFNNKVNWINYDYLIAVLNYYKMIEPHFVYNMYKLIKK